jgi:hypothetical protein
MENSHGVVSVPSGLIASGGTFRIVQSKNSAKRGESKYGAKVGRPVSGRRRLVRIQYHELKWTHRQNLGVKVDTHGNLL